MKSLWNFWNSLGLFSFVKMSGQSSFFILGTLSGSQGFCSCGLLCWIFVRIERMHPMLLEYFFDCSSTPAIMRSTTVGSSSIIMVVPTYVSALHFILLPLYPEVFTSLCCCAVDEHGVASLSLSLVLFVPSDVCSNGVVDWQSLMSPSFVLNFFSTSSSVRGSSMRIGDMRNTTTLIIITQTLANFALIYKIPSWSLVRGNFFFFIER